MVGSSRYIVVRKGAYPAIVDYLEQKHSFRVIPYETTSDKMLPNKIDYLKACIRSYPYIWKQRSHLRAADSLVSIGNYETMFILLLNRLKIIHPQKVYWLGFFFHSQKVQQLLRWFLRPLLCQNVRIILFSESEQSLYAKTIGIDYKYFRYVPYGTWCCDDEMLTTHRDCGPYYFAGGYSNRDYVGLLDAWNSIQTCPKLVIVASKNNIELVRWLELHALNSHITVHFDISSGEFDMLLSHAKACIIPLKDDTGASGQSVSLRCMRQNKLIISADVQVMREYVIDGKTGILYSDIRRDLPNIISNIENNAIDIDQLTKASSDYYMSKFSLKAVRKSLDRVLSLSD